ncbi:transglycosylase domain-containing protein [Ideonella sp. YS5]|uniref:transglycosylase domain-containing protein n=1 Tax=Ideonella sp. YS5 TaxID=3453714 RepID=UPI003EED9574
MIGDLRILGRLVGLIALCVLSLQLYFAARIGLMAVIAPESTTFQRSEIARLATEKHQVTWSQEWVADARISPQLKRAVIASEDAGFADHSGVEWDAIEAAWEKNQKAEARAERINEQLDKREAQREKAGRPVAKPLPRASAKVVGGSTITQQLAKNLFLSSERTALRKAQEIVLAYMLEALLDKRRILEIYLNSVEWGEGLFGAQAAARHYFHVDAAQLGAYPAARLAVMLPAPKRFEKNPGSAYVSGRAGTIVARMGAVELP